MDRIDRVATNFPMDRIDRVATNSMSQMANGQNGQSGHKFKIKS